MKCYKVKVKTTNAIHKTVQACDGNYYDCRDGEIYVSTNDPRKIYDKLGDVVLNIELIGFSFDVGDNLNSDTFKVLEDKCVIIGQRNNEINSLEQNKKALIRTLRLSEEALRLIDIELDTMPDDAINWVAHDRRGKVKKALGEVQEVLRHAK